MVAFEDRFWGEKNGGYDVMYHNMKYGNNVSVKVTEFIRERFSVEENYSKALIKLAKSACTVSQLGSFDPLWGVMRVATERLASAHHTVVIKLQELAKEVKEYGDKQKEKHKTAKEEFSSTAEIVQTMQTITMALLKSKESYYARCHELEKCKKDVTSSKEIEKAEAKMRKACEDYKSLVEKREIIRNEFHDKMVETSRRFQQIEEEHLKTIVGHLEIYIDSHLSGWKIMEEVHTEFRERLRALSTDKLLDQLVRSKGTGTDIPGVITFEEYEGQQDNSVNAENSPSLNNKAQTIKPQLPGFPLHKKKKEKKEKEKKKPKKKKEKEKEKEKSPSQSSQNSQESPEHQENGPVDSPVSEGSEATAPSFEVDEEGYRIRPPDTESAKSAGYSSDSDSDSDDDDEPLRRIKVTIKPADDKISQTASADEIKKITESLSLSSPASMRRNMSSTLAMNDGFRTRASTENHRTVKLSRSSDDLLDITFGHSARTMPSPGSDSSLSKSNVSSSLDVTTTSAKDTNSIGTFDSFTSLPPFATSSPAASLAASETKNDNTATNEDEDIPPALPKKKNSQGAGPISLSEDLSIPPPLPAKREAVSGLPSLPGSNLSALSNSGSSEVFKPPVTATTALPLLLKPPGGGEIPRVGSTGSALARPRPQKKTSLQSQANEMSFSQELFTFMSDVDLNAKFRNDKPDSEDGEPKTPKTPSKVSYVGSVALGSATTSETTQVMTRATTTNSLPGPGEAPPDRQEGAAGLLRSKTVGAMPTVPSRIHAATHSSHKEDVLPIAVAFIESVNAFFRGNDHKGCMVKVTGDITVSFPASIVAQLTSDKDLPSLSFYVTGTSSLDQLLPNKTLISSEGQQSGGDAVSYKFNMTALSNHLKKQLEAGTSSYYNIDILKYEVRTIGIQSTPLQLCSYWKCEPTSTNIRIDYRYNHACMSTPCALTNVSIITPVNGGVTIMQSKPSATWSAESERAIWLLPEISGPKDPDGTLRARLDLTEGPSTPSRIAVQFSSTGATISKLNFELKSDAYKLSLVKKQIATGMYFAES